MEALPTAEVLRPPPRGPITDLHRGILLGMAFAGLFFGLMAAGGRSQDPVKVIDAILALGVPLDERVQRLAPPVRRSILCVALAILMEARGEPDAGQVGVAWVVRTRSEERDESPCDVIFATAQFTWSSFPLKRILLTVDTNRETYLEAQSHAWSVFVDSIRSPVGAANHFWGYRAIPTPAWARQAVPGSKVVIGNHAFVLIPYRRAFWAR